MSRKYPSVTASLMMVLMANPLQAWAVDEDKCPLRNPVYKDLRVAAAALEKKVELPPGCEELQKKLEDAGEQISGAAEELAKLKADGADAPASAAAQNNAAIAVKGVLDIERAVSRLSPNDRCGRELAGAVDYLEALIDTVNTLSPYLLLMSASNPAIGGAASASYVLGANVLGSAVKTFITIFKSRSFDMTKTDQRQVFIENACGYHRLSENIFSIIAARELKVSEVDREVGQLKDGLEALSASEPPKPEVDDRTRRMDEQLKQDRQSLSDMKALIGQLGESDEFVCYWVGEQVAESASGAFPSAAVSNLKELVRESQAAGRVVLESQHTLGYFEHVNRPERFSDQASDRKECATRSREWVKVVNALVDALDAELTLPGRRDLSETPVFKKHQEWQKQVEKKKEALAKAEARQKFLHQLAAEGEEIEMAELLHNWTAIRHALFGSEKRRLRMRPRYKGPAEAWLNFTDRAARDALSEFHNRLPLVDHEVINRPADYFKDADNRKYACSSLSNTYLAWYNAFKDVKAAQRFCSTFGHAVDERSFPAVTRYCLGSSARKQDARVASSKVEKRLRHVELYRPHADAVYDWMKHLKCSLPHPAESI